MAEFRAAAEGLLSRFLCAMRASCNTEASLQEKLRQSHRRAAGKNPEDTASEPSSMTLDLNSPNREAEINTSPCGSTCLLKL
ncbi:hypothetical protein KUV26_21465 [Leisingera daeponensis]|uniref:Uncharacterized protein n=1 Tax=Leisingera daeponensis TaxID=405746 RepID=A0ABS7NPF6_9RHOB|nr:hypothetical protein [Leisingera daeponensis]MBY6142011.1 hypothetical protein [Leisingera daeponensis]